MIKRVYNYIFNDIEVYAMKKINKLLLILILVALVKCGQNNSEDLSFVIEDGKEDNFFSLRGQEYRLDGVSTVTLEEEYLTKTEDEKLERVKELIGYKNVVIGWFLNTYLINKDKDDSNKNYGGYDCLVRNGAYQNIDIAAVNDLTYSFSITLLVGGERDLLHNLPLQTNNDGKQFFTLKMGIIDNELMSQLETNDEWYRRSPWSSFNPDNYSAEQLETIDLTIAEETASKDAWIDYNRLFEDNLVTIDIFFGWDYHSDYHLKHSESVYNWLIDNGFTSPVDSYDSYTHESGPLTKLITANGKQVRVEVSLFWGKIGTPTNPDTDEGGIVLENLMKSSLKNHEVIIYSGHSGPFYGFALANWRKTSEGDLDDSEIPDLDMPLDVYQLVVAEGCDTYSIGEAFWHNPAKDDRKNLDIITTTAPSNASSPDTVLDLLNFIAVGTNTDGEHNARKYSEILSSLDSNSFWFNTMYGIHGIDDNPHIHPYASMEYLCHTCEGNDSCGGQGMSCITLVSGTNICAPECTADDGCPDGYKCKPTAASDGYRRENRCVPVNQTCPSI